MMMRVECAICLVFMFLRGNLISAAFILLLCLMFRDKIKRKHRKKGKIKAKDKSKVKVRASLFVA